MSLKHLTIGALVAVCIFVAQAAAQKNELSAVFGRTATSDQSIPGAPAFDPDLRFGNGFTFEANYTRRVMILGKGFFSLNLEVPFVVNPHEKLHAALPNRIPDQYTSYFVTPSARLNVFAGDSVSPWISLGGGYGRFQSSSHQLFGGNTPGDRGTNTGVLQAGVGLDVKIFRGFSVRGEGRDLWSGVPHLNVKTDKSRQHNLFAGAGIVWRF